MRKPSDDRMREAAERKYASEGAIEIDLVTATLSRAPGNPDKGAYVQAWVWVYDEEARV